MNRARKVPVTITIVAINIIVFFILSLGGQTENVYYMLNKGAMYTPYVLEGEYYRMFTCIFMHFGFEHLISNMFSLVVMGYHLEPVLGSVKTGLLFVVSGLGGNVLSLIMEMNATNPPVSAGASGAIFGLTGALLTLTCIHRGRVGDVTWKGMLLMVALSLYTGFANEGVDNAAHIGGLIAGILLTLIVGWKLHNNKSSRV